MRFKTCTTLGLDQQTFVVLRLCAFLPTSTMSEQVQDCVDNAESLELTFEEALTWLARAVYFQFDHGDPLYRYVNIVEASKVVESFGEAKHELISNILSIQAVLDARKVVEAHDQEEVSFCAKRSTAISCAKLLAKADRMSKKADLTDTCNLGELLDKLKGASRPENPVQALVKDVEELERRIARLEEHNKELQEQNKDLELRLYPSDYQDDMDDNLERGQLPNKVRTQRSGIV